MKNLRKAILVSLIFIFCFSVFVSARETEVDYPEIGNSKITTTRTLLPDYVRYLLNFGIYFAGLVSFGSLVYAGGRYLTSSGNTGKMTDALGRIKAAGFGLLIVFGSYLLLATINPQLLTIDPNIKEAEQGIVIFKTLDGWEDCKAFKANKRQIADGKVDGKDYLFLRTSQSDLGDLEKNVGAIYFYKSKDDLEAKLYKDKKFETAMKLENYPPAGECIQIVNGSEVMAIALIQKGPGVYLCKTASDDQCLGPLAGDQETLESFDNEIEYVKFKNPKTNTEVTDVQELTEITASGSFISYFSQICLRDLKGYLNQSSVTRNEKNELVGSCEYEDKMSQYGVVVHEHDKLGLEKSSTCRVYLSSDQSLFRKPGGFIEVSVPSGQISSATIFLQSLEPTPEGEGVTLYKNKNYDSGKNEDEKKLFPAGNHNLTLIGSTYENGKNIDAEDVWSLKMNGDYIAVLFDNKNENENGEYQCLVYRVSDPDISNEPGSMDAAASLLRVIKIKY